MLKHEVFHIKVGSGDPDSDKNIRDPAKRPGSASRHSDSYYFNFNSVSLKNIRKYSFPLLINFCFPFNFNFIILSFTTKKCLLY